MDQKLYTYILQKQHRAFRKSVDLDLAEQYSKAALSPEERMTKRFELLCSMETPVIMPNEQICFMRTVANLPEIFTEQEKAELKKHHYIHELGYVNNVCPDYANVINNGLLSLQNGADAYSKRAINSILKLTERYQAAALEAGRQDIATVLSRVPKYPARTLREALQCFRIIHFALWLEGEYHNTVGRFDQYIYPYYKKDIESGELTEDSALELIEDFFLSFNKDNDLYPGVQQGDNGQSLMLGGSNPDGSNGFNSLSALCLKASRALKLIDPKINLRVNNKTPNEIYTLGSELTKAGLGFPQYSNDDVVIPGLVDLGYSYADACNYTVAACWEYIIPKYGTDIANIASLSYPKVMNSCLHKHLIDAPSFDDFMSHMLDAVREECETLCSGIHDVWMIPAPFMNVVMGYNVAKGGRYNNFGIHGTGLSTAVDSLAVINHYVYQTGEISKKQLLEAVDSNFEQHSELLPILRYEAPKFGNNDDAVDTLAVQLTDCFADCLRGKTNCKGGIYRAGTGSAMFYILQAAEIGASPDGRRAGEPFGANLAVSLFAKIKGPVSVIQSMTKLHLRRTINGGPLTLELHSSVFSDPDSTFKVGQLVKSFIKLGGHQLQLNAVNREALLDAQKHPELYSNLIVRIWGWSAYFTELSRPYQDHVLARQNYIV